MKVNASWNEELERIQHGLRRALAGKSPTCRTGPLLRPRDFIRVRMAVRRTEYGAPVGPTYVETFDDYTTCSMEAARINAAQHVRRTGAMVWFFLGETRVNHDQ